MPLTVESRLHTLIVEQLGVNLEEITPTASFIDDLGADSIDVVELALAIENEFEIEIDDRDMEEMRTVEEVIEYVERRVKKGMVAGAGAAEDMDA